MPSNPKHIDAAEFAVVTDRHQKHALLSAIANEGWSLITDPGAPGAVMFRSPEGHRKSFVAFLGGSISHYRGEPGEFRIIVGNSTVGIKQIPPVLIEYFVTKGVISRDLASQLFRYAGKSLGKMYKNVVPLANARDASLVQDASSSIIPMSECRDHISLVKTIIEEDWVPTYVNKAVRFVDPKNTRRVVAVATAYNGRRVTMNGMEHDGPSPAYNAYEHLANYAAQWDPRFKKVLPSALGASKAPKGSVYAIKDTLGSIVRAADQASASKQDFIARKSPVLEEEAYGLREPFSEEKIIASMRFMNRSKVAAALGVTGVHLNKVLREGQLSRSWRWRLTTFLKSAGVE